MRVNLATFFGAFLITLIYSTKPDSDSSITLSRMGDTAIVIDTVGGDDSAEAFVDTLSATVDTTTDSAVIAKLPPARGSPTPAVAPSDVDALRAQSLAVPVAGVAATDLIDSFDDKRGSDRRHNALDIMAARNTPAVAATSGTILKFHSSVAGGLSIYMMDATAKFIMMYGHLDSYRPGLKEGAAVKRGEIIGFVGTTGNASPTAPHLHFQIMRSDNPKEWWKGTPINPFLIYRPAP